jgi:hypothetical protein
MELNGQLHSLATLFVAKQPLAPTGQEAGWAPKLMCMLWRRERSFVPARNWTPAIQPVAFHYTNLAIPAPYKCSKMINFIGFDWNEHNCKWRGFTTYAIILALESVKTNEHNNVKTHWSLVTYNWESYCLALNTLQMNKHATWLISSTDIWRPSKWSKFMAVLVNMTSHSQPQAVQQNKEVKANRKGATKLMQTFQAKNLPKPVQWTVFQY